MEPFMLFVWDQYYPQGGINDLKGRFETADAATAAGETLLEHADYYAVYDVNAGQVVADGRSGK